MNTTHPHAQWRSWLQPLLGALLLGLCMAQTSPSPDRPDQRALEQARQALLKAADLWNEGSDSVGIYLYQALSVFQNSPDVANYVQTLNQLSVYHADHSQVDSASWYARLAYEVAMRSLSPSQTPYIDAITNLASDYYETRNLSKAITLSKTALELAQKNGAEPQSLAADYQNLAVIYNAQGDYTSAVSYLQYALALRKKQPEGQESAMAQNLYSLGWNYQRMKLFDQARHQYDACLEALTRVDPGRARFVHEYRIKIYHNLARISLDEHQPQRCLQFVQRAREVQQQTDGYREYLSAELQGLALMELGQYPAAEAALLQANEGVRAAYAEFSRHEYFGRIQANLGQLYARQGQLQPALQHYQQALQLLAIRFQSKDLGQNPEPTDLLDALEGIRILRLKAEALQAWAKTDPQPAQKLQWGVAAFSAAEAAIRLARHNFLSQGSKHQLAAEVMAVYEGAIAAAIEAHRISANDHYLHTAFRFAERNKATLLLESLNEQAAKAYGGIPDSILEKEQETKRLLTYLESAINTEKSKGPAADTALIQHLNQQLYPAQTAWLDLKQLMTNEFPRYFQLKYESDSIPATHLLSKPLRSGQDLFVEYFMGEKQLFTFVLHQDSIQAWASPWSDSLEQAMGHFLDHLQQPPTAMSADSAEQVTNQMLLASYTWYQTLLAPALAHRQPKRIILVPDGILLYLPFEVLLRQMPHTNSWAADQQAYLFESSSLSYNYSAVLWYRSLQLKQRPARGSFVGFAPAYPGRGSEASSRSGCAEGQFYALACHQQEVEAATRHLGGQAVLGHEASSTRFRAEAPHYDLILLATHSCTDDTNPMMNKIILADSFITNYDLFNLQLKAQLVVLSSCNSGRGRLIRGEGVMSLAKGFFYAGVPSAVMSLWSIDDCATASLMDSFFAHLRQGEDKDVALQKARMAYLQQADKLHRHPYYWAAFVQVGHTQALRSRYGYFLGWAGAALLLGLAAWLLYRRRSR